MPKPNRQAAPVDRIARATGLLAGCALAAALAGCAQNRAPPPAAHVAAAADCVAFSFPIYFETNSDQLTAAARQVLGDAVERVRGCTFGRIDVVGLADASGGARVNLALSRRRADTVAKALAAGGLPRPEFDIDAVGEVGAVTPSGDPEPLRRRTEVVIRASPPAGR